MSDDTRVLSERAEGLRFGAGTAMLVVAALLGISIVAGLLLLPEATRALLSRPLAGTFTLGQLIGGIVLGLLLAAFSRSELAAKLWRTLVEEVLTNWQLFLLGVTGLVLSLASGYTTWDGMTNFTGDAILSLMITFGIQGIMLIAAWLIGESFAVGMGGGRGTKASSQLGKGIVWGLITLAGLALIVMLVPILFDTLLGTKANNYAKSLAKSLEKNQSLMITVGATALGLLALGIAVAQREIVSPYFRGLKIILSNLPIWVMFLACAMTSVFFSFDSLFSTIFPQEERARAGDLRTLNQVSGLVADIGATIGRRRIEETDKLFRSEEWNDYESRLDDLVKIARKAPDAIRATILKDLQDRQAVTASLQEKKASAQGQRVKLEKRKEELLSNVNALKAEVAPVAAEVDKLKTQMFEKERDIVARKAAAESEARGVGNSGKAGRGPKFKELNDALKRAQEERAVLALQLKEFEDRLKISRDSVGTAEAELAQIDGELGKLRGESEVADKQISVQSDLTNNNAAPTADASGGLDSLELARAQFRQAPVLPAFEAIQKHCSDLLKAFERVGELRAEAETKNVRCDPGIVADQASRVFALTAGLERHRNGCGKGENLPQSKGSEALLEFGANCVQDSGLSGEDTIAFRQQLNRVALGRDDKAHRFVVSWNAFLDGNQLAYLALSIATALDALVFMSGLFGANAVRSTLTDLPHGRRRSAAQLQGIVDTALLPDRFGNARLVIEQMRPITRDAHGHIGEIVIEDIPSELLRAQVRKVLSAGATINAVSNDASVSGRYLVRAEFYEYLAEVCERELKLNPRVRAAAEQERGVAEAERRSLEQGEIERRARLETDRKSEAQRKEGDRQKLEERDARIAQVKPTLKAALLPDVHVNSGLVLENMHPVEEDEFTSELVLDDVKDEAVSKVLKRILNAGSALKLVRHSKPTFAAVRDDVIMTRGQEASALKRYRYLVRPEFTICVNELHQESYDTRALPVVRPPALKADSNQRNRSDMFRGVLYSGGEQTRVVSMQDQIEQELRQQPQLDAYAPRPKLPGAQLEPDEPLPDRPTDALNQPYRRGGPLSSGSQVEFLLKPSFENLQQETGLVSADQSEADTVSSLRNDNQLVNRYVRDLINRLVPYNSLETLRDLTALQAERPLDFENIDDVVKSAHPKLVSQIEVSRGIWLESLNSKYLDLRSEIGSANRPILERAMGRVASLAPISACNDVYKSLSLELDSIINRKEIDSLLGHTKSIGRRLQIERAIDTAFSLRAKGMKELPEFASAMYELQDYMADQGIGKPPGAKILSLKPPTQ